MGVFGRPLYALPPKWRLLYVGTYVGTCCRLVGSNMKCVYFFHINLELCSQTQV